MEEVSSVKRAVEAGDSKKWARRVKEVLQNQPRV
jgi:hypothetical protein